jgi:DNA modification methylase
VGEDIEIIQGNALDVLLTLGDRSVSAIITDPPYGTEVEGDGYGRRQNYGGVGRAIAGDTDLSVLGGVLAQAGRLLVRNSWVALFCSPKRHAEVAALAADRGFPVAGEVIWDKASPGLGAGIRYQHETVLLCRHGKPAGRSALFSVVRSYLSRADKHKRHPHEKPVDLMSALVRYCSRPGELVLDPCCGAGSTLIACRKSGRRAIGIEIDPRHAATARRRLADAATPLFRDEDAAHA